MKSLLKHGRNWCLRRPAKVDGLKFQVEGVFTRGITSHLERRISPRFISSVMRVMQQCFGPSSISLCLLSHLYTLPRQSSFQNFNFHANVHAQRQHFPACHLIAVSTYLLHVTKSNQSSQVSDVTHHDFVILHSGMAESNVWRANFRFTINVNLTRGTVA